MESLKKPKPKKPVYKDADLDSDYQESKVQPQQLILHASDGM